MFGSHPDRSQGPPQPGPSPALLPAHNATAQVFPRRPHRPPPIGSGGRDTAAHWGPKAERHAGCAQETVPHAGWASGILASQGTGLADSPQHRGPRPHVKVAHPSYLGPTCSPPPPGGCAEWPWPWGHDLGDGPHLRGACGQSAEQRIPSHQEPILADTHHPQQHPDQLPRTEPWLGALPLPGENLGAGIGHWPRGLGHCSSG